MIIMTVTDHSRNIMNGLWNVSDNLPLHMCGLTNLIACSVLFTKLNKRVFEFLLCGNNWWNTSFFNTSN